MTTNSEASEGESAPGTVVLNWAAGIGLKLFGFIPEAVFTFTPESCSRSSRNTVRNHTGIAFTLPRIPHGLLYLSDGATILLRGGPFPPESLRVMALRTGPAPELTG